MHVSMVLPPPTAISPSQSLLRAYSPASSMERSVGSTSTPSKTSAFTPCSLEERAHASGAGRARQPWRSVTISALRRPRRRASKPISSMAPSPNLIGDISITNTVSVGSVTPFMRASSGWRCVGCPAGPRL